LEQHDHVLKDRLLAVRPGRLARAGLYSPVVPLLVAKVQHVDLPGWAQKVMLAVVMG